MNEKEEEIDPENIITLSDEDKDRIIDFKDNCKEVSNPDQLDSDKD